MNTIWFSEFMSFLGSWLSNLLSFKFPGTDVPMGVIVTALLFLPLIIRVLSMLFNITAYGEINGSSYVYHDLHLPKSEKGGKS